MECIVTLLEGSYCMLSSIGYQYPFSTAGVVFVQFQTALAAKVLSSYLNDSQRCSKCESTELKQISVIVCCYSLKYTNLLYGSDYRPILFNVHRAVPARFYSIILSFIFLTWLHITWC